MISVVCRYTVNFAGDRGMPQGMSLFALPEIESDNIFFSIFFVESDLRK